MAKQVAVAQRVYVEAPCSAAWGPRACAAWHLDHLWRTVVSEAADAVRALGCAERERERESESESARLLLLRVASAPGRPRPRARWRGRS